MNSPLKIYLIVMAAFLCLMIFVAVSTPDEVDWRPTYSLDTKNPYDLYVFNHEVDRLLPKGSPERVTMTPYQYFSQHTEPVNILFIRKDMYEFADSLLLEQVARGNNLWISAENYIRSFTDSLGVRYADITPQLFLRSIPMAKLTLAMNGWHHAYTLRPLINTYAFVKMKAASTDILGREQLPDSVHYPSFIRIRYGKGTIFLHNHPQVFTNVAMLDSASSAAYVAHVLSYLPRDRKTVWFVNNQTQDTGAPVNETSLSVIFRYPALRAAWLLFIYGAILYLLFNAKRRQRIVPVITPLKNTTVEFIQTIGNLYYQEGNTGNLMEKKIIYFLDRIRARYYQDTAVLDEKFAEKLQIKSGRNRKLIDEILSAIHTFRENRQAKPADLINLNELMERFWDDKAT